MDGRHFRRESDAAEGRADRDLAARNLFANRVGVLMDRLVVIGAGAMGLAAATTRWSAP